jgi:hypothetical protein
MGDVITSPFGGFMSRIMVDYAGQKFNMLTAVEFHHKISNNAYYWKFICDCGKEVITNLHDVRRGKIQSCGCIKRKLTDDELGFRRTYQTYRDQAISRNIEWLLTEGQVRILFKSNCYYCGSASSNHRQRIYKDRMLDYIYSGIDRFDNTLGYLYTNCVPCCSICNRMKLNHTPDMFIQHIKKILVNMEAKHENTLAV